MKALFSDSVHEVIDSGRFTFTVEEWFKLDAKNGPYEMRSGTSGTKETPTWHSVARRAPTLTSNGLIARDVRTGEVWRVLLLAGELGVSVGGLVVHHSRLL